MDGGRPLDEALFERIALGDPITQWELEDGALREKPGGSVEHNSAMSRILVVLGLQLDHDDWRMRGNAGYLRVSATRFYVPDSMVIPADLERSLRGRPHALEVYRVPLPLVIEVWAPPSGHYDDDAKIPGYQARGDAEIWLLHPYERTLTRWVRREDGGYDRSVVTAGSVTPAALPPVTVELDRIFIR